MSISENKQAALLKITKEIEQCRICKQGTSGKAVPGEGNPDASLVFIGEAPGKTEAKTGRPFVGRSGQLLRKLIREVGLTEEEVFITSPVKYLPDQGTPTPVQIAHGRTHLRAQLNIINPKYLVLLGKTAGLAILEKNLPILQDHGKIFEVEDRKCLLTLHPAAVLRFPKYAGMFKADLLKLMPLLRKN